MAKRSSAVPKVTDGRQPDDVMVMARAGFKHRGMFIRTGETCYMARAEAKDLKALHMVEPLQSLDEVPNG